MGRIFPIPLVALLASFALATGQEIGTEICSCTPRTYEFTLDFSLTCPPVNITLGDAVEATSCLVSPFGTPNVADLVPVTVEGIDILELGQTLRVVAQTDIDGQLFDGDTFTYSSVVTDPDSIDTVLEVPRALQLNIVGSNADGDRIINVFIVTFTNVCDSYPIFQEGQSAGWTRFTGIGPGSPELCSAIPSIPTPSPTLRVQTDSPVVPTVLPVATDAPVSPTPSPVAPPTGAPVVPTASPIVPVSEAPTDSPTFEPTPGTDAPVVDPTDAPIAAVDPTDAPVAEITPTDAPVDVDFPTIVMSMSMEMSMPGRLLEEFWENSKNVEFGERRLRRTTEETSRRTPEGKKETSNIEMEKEFESRQGYSRLRI